MSKNTLPHFYPRNSQNWKKHPKFLDCRTPKHRTLGFWLLPKDPREALGEVAPQGLTVGSVGPGVSGVFSSVFVERLMKNLLKNSYVKVSSYFIGSGGVCLFVLVCVCLLCQYWHVVFLSKVGRDDKHPQHHDSCHEQSFVQTVLNSRWQAKCTQAGNEMLLKQQVPQAFLIFPLTNGSVPQIFPWLASLPSDQAICRRRSPQITRIVAHGSCWGRAGPLSLCFCNHCRCWVLLLRLLLQLLFLNVLVPYNQNADKGWKQNCFTCLPQSIGISFVPASAKEKNSQSKKCSSNKFPMSSLPRSFRSYQTTPDFLNKPSAFLSFHESQETEEHLSLFVMENSVTRKSSGQRIQNQKNKLNGCTS